MVIMDLTSIQDPSFLKRMSVTELESLGSDELNDKTTYPKLLGLEGAKQALDQEVEAAQAAIESLSVPAPLLLEMLSFVVKRNH